ncbi:MAG: ADP-ribosylglycohydrolase family protein, partial [Armatimonadetes bacterium]|nr:ADP-ribosylglycohydrolase family protein [Candidatus Hippobium faecium]
TLQQKIEGALLGAYIGGKLGYAPNEFPELIAKTPEDMEKINLKPISGNHKPTWKDMWHEDFSYLTEICIRAYIKKQGRITPEDFAEEFKNDETLAHRTTLAEDILHTTVEILKEGMNPRISGIGNVESGIMCPAAIAVGIYHAGDPDYAYLDGVEIASVNQPIRGADWAAAVSAAIAVALKSEGSVKEIISTLQEIMMENNKDCFYDYFNCIMRTYEIDKNNKETAYNWFYNFYEEDFDRRKFFFCYNPMRFIIPLMTLFEKDVVKALQWLITVPHQWNRMATAPVAAAIYGALYGKEIFPKEWLDWAEEGIKEQLPIIDVVLNKKEKEKSIAKDIDLLLEDKSSQKTENIRDTKLYDKIVGCLMAGAIGNAMGSPVESRMYWEIDEKYPDHIMGVLDPRKLEAEDDNQMAMHMIETYLRKEGAPIMARDFGKTWKEKLNRDMFFVSCMAHTYDLIMSGWDPRITGHWNQVTGSTVMCMEPVGIYHVADPENARIDATAISYMYQRGLDLDCAASLAATVAECFKDGTTVDKICQAALNAMSKDKLKTFDERPYESAYDYMAICLDEADRFSDVFSLREGLYKHLNYSCICPLELWAFAVAIFKCAKGDMRMTAIG